MKQILFHNTPNYNQKCTLAQISIQILRWTMYSQTSRIILATMLGVWRLIDELISIPIWFNQMDLSEASFYSTYAIINLFQNKINRSY